MNAAASRLGVALPLVQAPKGALRGSPVAVFVTGEYQVQPVGSGSSSSCVPAGP